MRFPEFSDEWQQTTLGEIGYTYNGLSGKRAEDFGKGKPYITYKMIYENERIDLSKVEYVFVSEIEEQSKVKQGDILFTTSSETADETGLCSVLTADFGELYLNSFCFGYRLYHRSLFQSIFFGYVLRSPLYRTLLSTLSQGSTRYNISKKEVMRLPISLPTLAELEKIASFLSLLDERIEAQRQIIKEHKTLKRATIQEIFSRIREWDSLEHLVDRGAILLKRGEIIPKSEYSSTNQYPVYSSSVRNKGLMGYTDKFMFDDERITWSIDGGGDLFYRHPHQYSVTNVCGILEILGKYDYRFLCAMLQIQHSRLNFDYQTKAHPSVIVKLYKVPRVHFEQQVHYGELFVTIDERIEVEEKLLQKYEEQKRYLLRKMFV